MHGQYSVVRGVISASPTENSDAAIPFYPGEEGASLTLLAGDRLVITDIYISAGGGANQVWIYEGDKTSYTAQDGIFSGSFQQGGGVYGPLATEHICTPGKLPHFQASAATQLDIVIRGYIWPGG